MGFSSVPREESEDLLPIRLYNAMSSWENPLHYPAGIAVVPPIPNTKHTLFGLTGV
jgi:hypothetical protein